ncbi:hypothetical protein FSP39_011162 [Pinctada imbricata]|uniref:Uncharacterized protein n=1 Tax=Pinctada imbricata TaxID=66713 RepID=A0AA88XW02_PINIB|nr:hypothetical protein FSP39_011162 [Pinctada imbricata]
MLHKQRKVSCAIFGDGMIGKSALIKAFLGEKFSHQYIATTSETHNGCVRYEGEKYNVEITDLAGEREEGVFSNDQFRNTDVFIVCYSVNDRESFDGIRSFWIPELCKQRNKPKIVLVGLQSDGRLKENAMENHVSYMEGLLLQHEIKAIDFVESSAFLGSNINCIFESVVDITVKHRKKRMFLLKRAFGR